MRLTTSLFLIIILLITSCQKQEIHPDIPIGSLEESFQETVLDYYNNIFSNPIYTTDGFNYPVGNPDGKGYYNAQGFTKNYHLGDDWNGVGGGNTDFGDPVYAVANGYVFYTANLGRRSGWGKVIRIMHKMENHPLDYVESLYAHCDQILVKEGTYVRKGHKIGTIGNAEGLYKAHLHLEIRNDIFMGVGAGYSDNFEGYLNPTMFIDANRKKW